MTQTEYMIKGRSPKLPPEQLLSLCMIVRNEERVLGDCLRSVRGVVDEMVIVDTGSTDQTVAIAEQYHAKVVHFAWTGSFADARNAALEHCTCRYVLQLDADERLEDRDRDRLRVLMRRPAADAYEVQVVSKRMEGKKVIRNTSEQARIFRRDPRFRYRYRIHETVLPSIREAEGTVAKEAITIHHVGYDISNAAMRSKQERNFDQLEISAREHPFDLFILKKYAQTLLVLGKNEEAVCEIRETLAKIDAGSCGVVPAPSRASFYNLYAEALLKTGEYETAKLWAEESLCVLKEQNAAHYFLTLINERLQLYDEALKHLNAIVLQKREGADAESEDEITPAPQDVCYKRATIYRAMKKPVDERIQLIAALRFDPAMTAALHDLAAFLARERKFSEALSLITKARDTEPANGSILHLRARILFQMMRFGEAAADAAAAYGLGETGDALLLFWIHAARESGREKDALPAHALLLERHPEAVEVLMPYIQLLVQTKAIPTAIAAVERALPLVKEEAVRQTLKTVHEKLASAARIA